MEIKEFPPTEQVDVAVDLGALPPPLPEIITLDQLEEMEFPAPPIVIEGILHQGCKMILGGTSKSNSVRDAADVLRYAVASKTREVRERKLTGW